MDRASIMEIEWECVRLSNAFAYYMDTMQYAKLAALFTDDGLFHRDGALLKGPAEILATISKRPANAVTRHVTTGHHFTLVEKDKAVAASVNRSYFAFADGVPVGELARFSPSQMVILDFEDTFRLTADGWRIAERKTELVLMDDSVRHIFGRAPR